MKGQQQALSAILITAILIGVVGSVYFWGLPLIQKNKDVNILESSESFMKKLDEKIKYVANNGGRDQMKVTVPGVVTFDNNAKIIDLTVSTQGVIYATGAPIPLGMNDCSTTTGLLGIERAEVLCVTSTKLADNSYVTRYELSYIELRQGLSTYNIDLYNDKDIISGSMDHYIIIENKGSVANGNLISTLIEINII